MMMDRATYREKMRMLAAISGLCRDYIRGTKSYEEVDRFMALAGGLLDAVEMTDAPPVIAMEIPAWVFDGKGNT